MNLTNNIKKLVRLILHFCFQWRIGFWPSAFDQMLLELYFWSVQPQQRPLRYCGEIEFELRFDEESQAPIKLKYGIIDRPLQRAWLKLFRLDFQAGKHLWFDGMFFGKLFCNEKKAKQKLVELVEQLSHYMPLPEEILSEREFSLEALNRLHILKENWAARQDLKLSKADAVFDHINYTIHQLEFIHADGQTGAINCVFLPPVKGPLSFMDGFEFSPVCELGGIYMDYGTNGVPMIDAFWGDVSQAPVPQTHINSGCKLYFYDRVKTIPLHDLEHWIRTKCKSTLFDLRNRVGHIHLGQLLHDNPTQLREQIQGASQIRVLDVKFNSKAF